MAMGRRHFFVRRLFGDEENQRGSIGWMQRAALEDMHASTREYVLRTKKFSVTEERARRERKSPSLEYNTESNPLEGVEATSTTPTKRPKSDPKNTPETVSTNLSDDDDEENETLTPDANVQSNEDEFECTICITPVDNGDRVGVTTCGHIFHSDCLKLWIARKNQCPLCKAEIASPRPTRSGGEEEEGGTPDNISGEMAAAHPRRQHRFLFPDSRPANTQSPRQSGLSLSFSNESEPNPRSRRRRTRLSIYE